MVRNYKIKGKSWSSSSKFALSSYKESCKFFSDGNEWKDWVQNVKWGQEEKPGAISRQIHILHKLPLCKNQLSSQIKVYVFTCPKTAFYLNKQWSHLETGR